MFNGDQSVMDCNLRDYENEEAKLKEEQLKDALEVGYRIDIMGRCAEVLADLVLKGKDIGALLKWLHDEAEEIVVKKQQEPEED